jgi:hypothetical protein
MDPCTKYVHSPLEAGTMVQQVLPSLSITLVEIENVTDVGRTVARDGAMEAA